MSIRARHKPQRTAGVMGNGVQTELSYTQSPS